MAGKRKRDEEEQSTTGWIITYADLVTLLLTFFVLLMSMSTLDEVRMRKVLDSLVGAFGLLSGGRSPIGKHKGSDVRETTAPLIKTVPFDYDFLKEITMKLELVSEVEFFERKEKLVIRIPDRVLFLPDSRELSPDARKYLATLAPHLKGDSRDIEIQGHTDQFENLEQLDWMVYSWTLSAQRAQAVYKYFREVGIDSKRMSAHGFAYYHPLFDSMEMPHMRYRNARVEIILGPSATVPSHLLRPKPGSDPLFNYKNFIFRLLPWRTMESGEQPDPIRTGE